jgi:predicted phosphodiesterase
VLSFGQKHFLRNLPLQVELERHGTRFYLCHAAPSDPLFGYCEANSDQWIKEIQDLPARIVLAGHTHVPVIRTIGNRTLVNPGSLGQPKTGSPEARYAVWQDGNLELKSYSYPFDAAARKVQSLPISAELRDELSTILRSGEIPPEPSLAKKEIR